MCATVAFECTLDVGTGALTNVACDIYFTRKTKSFPLMCWIKEIQYVCSITFMLTEVCSRNDSPNIAGMNIDSLSLKINRSKFGSVSA